MRNPTRKYLSNQIARHKNVLDGATDIQLNNILNSENNLKIIEQCREYRKRVFTPFVTLFTFVKQVLDPDKSCRKAISKVIAERLSDHEKACSQNTGPYCKARQKLPESMVKELVQELGKETNSRTPSGWKWKGRNVKVVDGTTMFMPDTVENQNIYPQLGSQKEGLGFPSARLVVIFSLAIGSVIDYAISATRGKGTGEHTLLRQIFHSINKGDVLLGDSYFPSYFLMAELYAKGCDGVFQADPHRHYDFRKGNQLGEKEHIVAWKKPKRPEWMDDKTYKSYPETIKVRECKVNGRIYVSTLLEPRKYHKQEIAQLYKLRWQAELNLKSIKSIMSMEMLSCKTPDMVRKEIGVHLLGYNIIRTIMAESGEAHGISPLQMSFKSTIQFINSFIPLFSYCPKEACMQMYRHVLGMISRTRVGNRPGRNEPKALKRRPKNYPLLMKPRSFYQKELSQSESYALA